MNKTDKFKSILARCPPGTVLCGDDYTFVRGMLDNHPDAAEKIGCGVHRIEVRLHPAFRGKRNKGFWIVRVDGTVQDFSYRYCITGKPRSAKGDYSAAMRNEVTDQTLSFKRDAFNGMMLVTCKSTHEPLSFQDAVVDHVIPFWKLRDDFLAGRTPDVADSLDGVVLLADRALAAEWHAYHRQNAQLQILSHVANAKKSGSL